MKHTTCPNCGGEIDRPVENAEDKYKTATSLETGKYIYRAILLTQAKADGAREVIEKIAVEIPRTVLPALNETVLERFTKYVATLREDYHV